MPAADEKGHPPASGHTKARAGARASERGQDGLASRKEGYALAREPSRDRGGPRPPSRSAPAGISFILRPIFGNGRARYRVADTLSKEERSERMSRVRGKDSKPEMVVRRLVHRMGYRYRLHRRDLPGTPDLVFPSRKKAIFVHGCFWHRHPDPACKLARLPKSRLDFWEPKLEGNRRRDRDNQARLSELGWDVLVVWECQIGYKEQIENIVRAFLERDHAGD